MRQLIVQHSEMRDATPRKGMPFVYTIGDRNAHLLELPEQEPVNPVWPSLEPEFSLAGKEGGSFCHSNYFAKLPNCQTR